MAIIKSKIRENPYLQIDKKGIDDENISFRATGLLAYLVGRPVNWNIRLEHLSKVKTEKKDAIKASLLELRDHNYCHYFEIRKSGRVKETFYFVFEVPTPYTKELHQEILESLEELEEGDILYYKTPKKNEPKTENPLSDELTEKKVVEPKTEKPLAAKPLAEKQTLIIIDDNNNRLNKKKNHDSDLISFEKIFEELGVDYNYTNQEAVQALLRKMKPHEVEFYLRELHKAIAETPGIQNVAALFSTKIKRGECQISRTKSSKESNGDKNTSQTTTTITHEDIKRKLLQFNVIEQKNIFEKVKMEFLKENPEQEAKNVLEIIDDNYMEHSSLTHLKKEWIKVLFAS